MESQNRSDLNTELLNLHERLLAADPVAPADFFNIVVPILERYLRYRFPSMGPGVDPDIYVTATFDALTDYFKDPQKYDPTRSGLMTYLRLAANRDLQNLLRKESRHAAGRTSLDSVEFDQSDGNDLSETVADNIDAERLYEELTTEMTPAERDLFFLMVEGERSTEAAADALGIGHLAALDRVREVKRVKDRIKKRIRRRGLSLS